MKANINEDELKLLAYLHEQAAGCGKGFQLIPSEVAGQLGFDDQQMKKVASYLSDHRLAGITGTSFENSKGQDFYLEGIYLTGLGEDYMRELENQPGVGKKITVAAVKEMGSALRTIAVGVLTELVKSRI